MDGCCKSVGHYACCCKVAFDIWLRNWEQETFAYTLSLMVLKAIMIIAAVLFCSVSMVFCSQEIDSGLLVWELFQLRHITIFPVIVKYVPPPTSPSSYLCCHHHHHCHLWNIWLVLFSNLFGVNEEVDIFKVAGTKVFSEVFARKFYEKVCRPRHNWKVFVLLRNMLARK